MKTALPKNKRTTSLAECTQKTLLPLFAVSGSLAVAPANAIELGEATVQSRLGQPLRASIAFALGPTEQLSESCISLGIGQSGLPGIGRATISIADGALLLNGSTPVREPLVAANVVINCPFAAKLAREYMMFVDPAGSIVDASPVAQAAPQVRPAPAPVSVPTTTAQEAPASVPSNAGTSGQAAASPARRAPSAVNREPIGQSARYQVQPGDSLSEIAQRIENRRMRLWAAVNVIFEANPDAFINNDPNKLKAGSWLTIPSLDGSAPVIASSDAVARPATAEAPSPEVASDTAPVNATQPEFTALSAQEDVAGSDQASPPASDATADLQPGALDPIPGDLTTEVPVAESEFISIPDTALPGPQTNSSTPNVTTAAVQPRSEQRTSSWLWWLAGSGAAIILALLLFGRTLRSRFGSTPFDVSNELPMADAPAEEDTLAMKAPVEYDIGDEEPTAENPALDADLVMGTGLDDNKSSGATQDVGLPSPTAVDIELPFASDDLATAKVEQTMRSASIRADETILESEILPDSDEYPDAEDFDMSVILDATKMPGIGKVAETGSITIEEKAPLEPTVEEPVTVATERDLTILEQDYEKEYSATLALKTELNQAAEKLVQDMEFGDDDGDEIDMDDDATAAMSLDSLSDYDVENRAAADNDERAATHKDIEELKTELFDEDTAKMPTDQQAITHKDIEELKIEFFGDEETVEMPLANEDKTRKMPRRGAKPNKKAG